MLRTIADGLLKREDINLRDPRSDVFTQLMVKTKMRQEQLQLTQLLWFRSMLQTMNPHISPEAVNGLMKKEAKQFDRLVNVLLDDDDAVEDAEERVRTALRKGWEHSFGDMQDPATQANIDRVAEGLRKVRQRNARLRRPKQ